MKLASAAVTGDVALAAEPPAKSRPSQGRPTRRISALGTAAGKKPVCSTATPRFSGLELAMMRPLASSSESERRNGLGRSVAASRWPVLTSSCGSSPRGSKPPAIRSMTCRLCVRCSAKLRACMRAVCAPLSSVSPCSRQSMKPNAASQLASRRSKARRRAARRCDGGSGDTVWRCPARGPAAFSGRASGRGHDAGHWRADDHHASCRRAPCRRGHESGRRRVPLPRHRG